MNIYTRTTGWSICLAAAIGAAGVREEPNVASSTSTSASFKELTDYALSYKDAAEAGNAAAQYNLGAAYRWGVGVTQDLAEAIKWIRKSAERGYAPAQRTLASFYEKGEGMPQSDSEALHWYKKAAVQGDAQAQDALAVLKAKAK